MAQTQYLTFHLGGEEYAIAILHVKEIIAYPTLTRVPQTAPFVRGVINLRGAVVPVIDLAIKFGLGGCPITNRTCIIIAEINLDEELTVIGILADAVNQVSEIAAADILPTPHFGTRVNLEFLHGIAGSAGKFVLILDIDKVLSSTDLIDTAPAGLVA